MVTENKHNGSIDAVRGFLKQLFPAEAGRHVWLVGGSVRDTLLGREIRDIDLVAALPPAFLESSGFRPVVAKTTAPVWFRHFREFGNVEITLIGHGDDLLSDLKRRDFTVNAMLMTIDGVLSDPLHGGNDLERLSLRHCSENTFSTDPLRIFRAFRMESEGFRIASGTGQLILDNSWEERLTGIPVERFGREMLKAFSAAEPWRFFQKMLEFDVGRTWLPELFRMPAVPAGPLEHHPEGDLLSHSLQVLERVAYATGSPLARFCAFFHDIGKISTDPALYPRHHGHEDAGFKAAEGFCRRLSLPVEYGRSLAWVSRLHGKANRFDELRLSTRLRMAEQAIRGRIAEILPLVSAADQPGNDCSEEWGKVLAVAGLNASGLGIDSQTLELLEPAKRSGFVLQKRINVLKSL